jgi:hypothetical protein
MNRVKPIATCLVGAQLLDGLPQVGGHQRRHLVAAQLRQPAVVHEEQPNGAASEGRVHSVGVDCGEEGWRGGGADTALLRAELDNRLCKQGSLSSVRCAE